MGLEGRFPTEIELLIATRGLVGIPMFLYTEDTTWDLAL